MKIIADSSTTRTEWVLVDGDRVVERAFTSGMNPFFQTRREISHCIRLELPDSFFRRRWDHVHFYGSGCSSADKNKVMGRLVSGGLHPACYEPFPDKLVQPELIPAQGFLHRDGRPAHIGGTDRLVDRP